jgi:hypothetical protein
MPIQLPFAEYQFSFTALERINMPRYSGTLWHAVLGKALHELNCLVPNSPCKSCLLASQCDYPALFQGRKPPNSEMMTRYQNIPTPHIIRSLQQYAYQIEAKQAFQVDIILLGDLNQKLPALIRAMQQVASNGLGRQRQKAILTQIVQKQPLATMNTAILMDGIPLQMGKSIDYPIPVHIPNTISLQMQTPYRQTGEARGSQKFQVDKFVMAVIRRISLLQYFTTTKQLLVDYGKLKQLTQSLVICKNTFYQAYDKQLAQRKNQHKQGHGWIGRVDIDLSQHQELWAYLYLGQWLEVGKNASMGFGQYKLLILD